MNRLNSDKVTRNVIRAPRDLLLLNESINDCFKTVNNANPPRVMINSAGNWFNISKTNGEYKPKAMHKRQKMIAETWWFLTLGSFIIIPVTGPVKHVETEPKYALKNEPNPQA